MLASLRPIQTTLSDQTSALAVGDNLAAGMDGIVGGRLPCPFNREAWLFFTRLGMVLAWLALVLGAMRLGPGLVVAWSDTPPSAAVKLMGSGTSGHAIDQGILMILLAVTLGTLTEVSRAVRQYGTGNR